MYIDTFKQYKGVYVVSVLSPDVSSVPKTVPDTQ